MPLMRAGRATSPRLFPEVLEPIRCQLGVANRVLDVLVPKVHLKGAGVMPLLARAKTQAWRSICG